MDLNQSHRQQDLQHKLPTLEQGSIFSSKGLAETASKEHKVSTGMIRSTKSTCSCTSLFISLYLYPTSDLSPHLDNRSCCFHLLGGDLTALASARKHSCWNHTTISDEPDTLSHRAISLSNSSSRVFLQYLDDDRKALIVSISLSLSFCSFGWERCAWQSEGSKMTCLAISI